MDTGGPLGVYVFSAMIVLCDQNGIIKISKESLFEKLKVYMLFDDQDKAEEQFDSIIYLLEAPDKHSNLPDHEGRRIIPLSKIPEIVGDRGWWIVNHSFYTKECSKEAKLDYDKGYSAAMRKMESSNKNNKIVNDRKQSQTVVKIVDIDIDVDINKDKRVLAQKSTKVDPFEESFIRFWNAYPRKMAKQAASKAWSKIEATEVDLLLERLEAFKQSHEWTKDDGNFIPYPATWLNGRRWEDELKNANGRPPAPTDPNDPYYTKDWSEDL